MVTPTIDYGFGARLITDPITIDYLVWLSDGQYGPAQPVTNVLEQPWDPDEGVEGSHSQVNVERRVFHLWTEFLGAIYPKQSDVVDKGGVRYTVKRVRHVNRGARHKVYCHQEV